MRVLIVSASGFEEGDDPGSHFARAFAAEGHEVRETSHRDVLRANPLPQLPPMRGMYARKADRAVLEAAREARPELIVVMKGETLTRDLLEGLRNAGAGRLVNVFPDNPFNYPSVLPTLPCYDAFCVKDSFVLDQLRRMGAAKAHWLPQCADPEALGAGRPPGEEERTRFSCDLVMVGSLYLQRYEILRCLDAFDLWVWGSTISELPKDDPLVARWHRGRPLVGAEKGAAFRTARIAINTHHPINDIHGVNKRTFEICGAGGFQLVDAQHDLPRCFEPGSELVTFSGREELLEKTRYYIAREAERAAVSALGLARVRRDHTYRHRVMEILDLMGFKA